MLTLLLLPVTHLVSCPFSLFSVLLSSVSIAHWAFSVLSNVAHLSCCQCCPLAPSQLLPDHPPNSQDCGFSRRLCFELDSASTKFNPSAVSIRQAVVFFLNPKLLIVIYQFGFGVEKLEKVGGSGAGGGKKTKLMILHQPTLTFLSVDMLTCGLNQKG